VALFRAARCVVLVHGAGLVNLVHRIGRPAAVAEVFPGDYAAPHLAWMAREFGFEYRAVRGDRRTEGEGFRVDVLSVGAAADEGSTARVPRWCSRTGSRREPTTRLTSVMGLGEELAEEARVVVPTRIHAEDVTHDRSTLPPPELRYRRSANVITEDSRHQRH